MKLPKRIISLAACSLLALASLSAQETLVSYDFTNTNLTPESWNSNLLTDAAKTISFTRYQNKYAADGARSAGPNSSQPNFYARVANMGSTQTTASSLSFTLTPLENQSIDLGQITFDIGYQNSGPSTHPSYTLNYQVGVTVGSNSEVLLSNIATLGILASTDPNYAGGSTAVDTPAAFDLSQFQGISSSITFTIYIYATNIGGTLTEAQTARIDNIMVSSAPIPEPTTIAILMGGFVMLATCVWHRRKS